MIDIQPAGEPSVVCPVAHLGRPGADGRLAGHEQHVEDRHGDSTSPAVEQLALAQYTQDAGNHVAISVRTAATVPLR